MEGVNSSRVVQSVATVKNDSAEAAKSSETIRSNWEATAAAAKAAEESISRMSGGGTGGRKGLLTNNNPAGGAAGPYGMGTGPYGAGTGPYTSGTGTTAAPVTKPNYSDDKLKDFFKGLLNVTGNMAVYASMLMPTSEEALRYNLLGNRYSFYGGGGGLSGGYVKNKSTRGVPSAYETMDRLARYGTAVSDSDAAYATNIGAGMGLLPGLKNYGVGQNFSGVMGGAALVSNLVPGAGLQGGVVAMAGLNQARNVNMLRMIGINVRNNAGTGMRDLPDIINQLYAILKQSAGMDPTPEMIAVSAMSGNALDSLLGQFFGNDENLRQSVIAALIQMSRTKGQGIGTSGSKSSLIQTGGTSKSVSNLSGRYLSEMKLKLATSGAVLTGTNAANDIITGLLNSLTAVSQGKGGTVGGLAGTLVQGLGSATGFASTLMGMGGGGFTTSIMNDLAYGLTGSESKLGPILKAIGIAGVAIPSLITGKQLMNNPWDVLDSRSDKDSFGLGGNYFGVPGQYGSVVPSSPIQGGRMYVDKNTRNSGISVTVYVTDQTRLNAALNQALDVAKSQLGRNY